MNGILPINKPRGLTSRDAVDLVSRSIHPRGTKLRDRIKVGHAGTLDPLATGVLLICVGSATRLVPLLHEHPKLYRAEFRLGQTSDSDDCEGTVTQHDVSLPSTAAEIAAILPEFVGCILQRPPAHSAVHVDGRRAYELAREQQPVELEPRPVNVYRFEIVDYVAPCLTVEIECGSGTYIRSLARDLGERLGVGALMSDLTRLAIGPFRMEGALSVAPRQKIAGDELNARLHPLKSAVTHLPTLTVNSLEAELVRHGGRLAWNVDRERSLTPPSTQIPARDAPPLANIDRVAIVEEQGDLAAIAELQANRLQPRIVFPR